MILYPFSPASINSRPSPFTAFIISRIPSERVMSYASPRNQSAVSITRAEPRLRLCGVDTGDGSHPPAAF
jgi:hypothetical protein